MRIAWRSRKRCAAGDKPAECLIASTRRGRNEAVEPASLVLAFCCWPLLQLMGRDYDAAMMASGFTGFMLGATANAAACS